MRKIIAKEVHPVDLDFSYYFEDEGLTNKGGENCAVYIVPADRRRGRWDIGFNMDEYRKIEQTVDSLIDAFEEVSPENEHYPTYKEAMLSHNIEYTSRKCRLLKKWAEYANPYDTGYIAEFLTITTGEEWAVESFTGYSQGDYCEVIYCVNHHTPERINEIGRLWLGCGTEFCIDGCYGYYVPDTIRWREGDELRQHLADCYGCKPEELEIYLYDGEHMVTDYKIMD
jgi:hypothetical protein